MTVDDIVQRFAEWAAQKEWSKNNYTSDEIINILMDKMIDYDKIDQVLIEVKKLSDPRYVNIITCRKIGKTNKKLTKYYFSDKHKLCCPQDNSDLWDIVIKRFDELNEDESNSDYSDNFDWATDESGSERVEHWDYIVPEIKRVRNIVKDIVS